MLILHRDSPSNPYVLGALCSVTVAALLTTVMYVAASFGSETAMNVLMNLSLPKFNPLALLIPTDLGSSRYGMEMVLGVVMAFLAAVFFGAWALWTKLTRR